MLISVINHILPIRNTLEAKVLHLMVLIENGKCTNVMNGRPVTVSYYELLSGVGAALKKPMFPGRQSFRPSRLRLFAVAAPLTNFAFVPPPTRPPATQASHTCTKAFKLQFTQVTEKHQF